MMKSIRTLVRQDQEKYVIPRRVQDVIPIQKIWENGIFLTGGRYAKTFRFTDINYQVASEPDKEKMFRGYSALINSLDCGATTKITIFNHKMSQAGIVLYQSVVCVDWDALRPGKGDGDFLRCRELHLIAEAVRIKGRIQGDFVPLGILQL